LSSFPFSLLGLNHSARDTVSRGKVATRGPNDISSLSLPEIESSARIVAVSRPGEQSAAASTMLATLRTLQLQPVKSVAKGRAARRQ
jgi:hypothetical protein